MPVAEFLLDLFFGVERRLRERKLEIEAAQRKQIADARAELMAEFEAFERAKRGSQ